MFSGPHRARILHSLAARAATESRAIAASHLAARRSSRLLRRSAPSWRLRWALQQRQDNGDTRSALQMLGATRAAGAAAAHTNTVLGRGCTVSAALRPIGLFFLRQPILFCRGILHRDISCPASLGVHAVGTAH